MAAIGSIIADKYRVDALLGEGAMGSVVAATHLELDKRVAIKLVKSEVAHPSGLDRFVQEARGVAKLRNEHICQVMDFGRLPDGAPYIVMERLDGETLEQRLAHGRLPVGEIARYVLEICEALDEAHTAGIVHRDLKPGNLFRVRKSNGTTHVKVLDFGVSKFQREAERVRDHRLRRDRNPGVYVPEQLRSSRDVDARSDIWALGVVMFQALDRRAAVLRRRRFVGLCTSIASDPPRALRRSRARERRADRAALSAEGAGGAVLVERGARAGAGAIRGSRGGVACDRGECRAVVGAHDARRCRGRIGAIAAASRSAHDLRDRHRDRARDRGDGRHRDGAARTATASVARRSPLQPRRRSTPSSYRRSMPQSMRAIDATVDATPRPDAAIPIDARGARLHAVLAPPIHADAAARTRCATDDPMCAFTE